MIGPQFNNVDEFKRWQKEMAEKHWLSVDKEPEEYPCIPVYFQIPLMTWWQIKIEYISPSSFTPALGRSVTVKVTDDDMKKGTPHNTQSCPVALALKRTLGAGDIGVLPFYCFVRLVTGLTTVAFTPEVTERIRAYDRGETVELFSFDVTLP
jgi:hypothetical protein